MADSANITEYLRTNHNYIVEGWLLELSAIIHGPVIFVFHDPMGADEESAFQIKDDTRDYHDIAIPLCDWLRNNKICNKCIKEKCCDQHDVFAARMVYQQFTPNPPKLDKGWKHYINGLTGNDNDLEGIQLFTYPCPLTGLIEWAIPLFVNEEFAGVIITGQYERDGVRKSVKEIREQLISQYKVPDAEKIDVNEIIDKKGIPEPQIGDKERDEFFIKISQIQNSINEEYKEVVAYRIQGIQSKLLDMIWDKDGFYPETYELDMKSILGIEPRFQAARTCLVDCAIYLKRILRLDSLIVFMPSWNLDRLDSSDTFASIQQ